MGIYRTYFEKNNTIVKNSSINTAKNPITELYCGDKVSRFLFLVNFQQIANMVENKQINISNGNIKHILKITNTSNFDVAPNLNVNNDISLGDGYRSASCDIELRPLTQFWDEGNGYDYEQVFLLGDNSYNVEASNWTNATTSVKFNNSGAVNTNYIIGTQHLDHGDENIEIDITNFVNKLLTTGITINTYSGQTTGTYTADYHNYVGFVLKYTNSSETAFNGLTKTIGFFTKYTNTFFEPYIETIYDDLIKDDRVNFYVNKDNNLFLYSNINGSLKNLDELPICTIGNNTFTVKQVSTGVYYVTIPADYSLNHFNTHTKYQDIWTNIKYNGVTLNNISLSFVPLDSQDYYQIGSKVIEPVRYGATMSGIKFGEDLTQGEIRKINVLLRKAYTLNDYDFVDDLYYRMYIKQGNNIVEIFDWQPISKSYDTHFTYLDTSWLIPQTYYIDLKVVLAGEVNIYNEQLRFTVKSKI